MEGFNIVFKKMVLNPLTLQTPFSATRPQGGGWGATGMQGRIKETLGE